MGVARKKKKKLENKEERKENRIGIGVLIWSKPNPISIGLFNMLAQDPVGPKSGNSRPKPN